MRTTVNLDDDAFRLIRAYARARALALGKAISELVRRGANTEPPTKIVNGLHIPDLKDSPHRVTTKRVKELLEKEDDRIPPRR